ncbi:MAG: amidohydrolase family protein [Bacteroidota bacterium]
MITLSYVKYSILTTVFLFCLSLVSLQIKSETTTHRNPADFYTREDFSKVRKVDVHVHINTNQEVFIDFARKSNFQFLDIVDDRPFGLTMDEQQKLAFHHLQKYPKVMAVATTFSSKTWGSQGWADETIKGLKKSLANGAKAVKIWKNIGMDLRDSDGKFVMVDDSRLTPVLDYLEQNNIPLIGHNGEPRDCWLPLDKMTFSKGYYSEHPEYHMFLHPEYPSYDAQIIARDNMLKKHPKLKFVGAHLGSLEWSLDELAKRFDRYPNMNVDLSRISNLQLHTLNDRQKTYDFFIKYQDRLVYGSDKAINATENADQFTKGIYDAWLRDWIFFATDENITLRGFGDLKGLRLPKAVIDKIYFKNADKWLNGTYSKN